MFPAVTAKRNGARRGGFVIFVFVFKLGYVSLRSLTVYQGIRDRPWVLNPGESTAHYV